MQTAIVICMLAACGEKKEETAQTDEQADKEGAGTVEAGTEYYRGFLRDNVFHSETEGDIHYNVYLPKDYDGSEAYALFLTLPGYQGLYFQGVGENLKTENVGFTVQEYNEKMTVIAPQLEDWGETSAKQTIALTEYFLEHYNINRQKVYGEGYSGGGETMSQVMGMKPDAHVRKIRLCRIKPILEGRACPIL